EPVADHRRRHDQHQQEHPGRTRPRSPDRPLGGGSMADRDRTVTGALRRRVEERPDQPYVKCGGDWITYASIDEQSDRVATGLAGLGVRPGDRLAVLLPNREEHLPLFFG